ncbi:MAG: Rieske (2Fe-2S) protein [Chitinophagales bacterium]
MENTRRSFLKTSGIVTGGLCCGATLLESCASYSYVPYSVEDKTIKVAKIHFNEKDFVALDVEKFPDAVLIHKLENGKYSAVLAECTHRKCTVKPDGTELKCPCHGSRFSIEGKVLKGPADKDLRTFTVSEDDQNVYLT